QVVGLGQMVFVTVVVAWSSPLYAKRGVAPGSTGRASDGLPRPERLAGSWLGAARVGATNAVTLMLMRLSRTSAAERTTGEGNSRVIKAPPFPCAPYWEPAVRGRVGPSRWRRAEPPGQELAGVY